MEIKNVFYEISKVLLVVLTTYISYYYYKYFTRENPLPGPFPLPFIGNAYQVFKKPALDLTRISFKYGDLCEFYMGSQRLILLGNNDLIQKINKPSTNDPFHNRVNDDNDGLKEIGMLNNGLTVNNNYDDWKYHRKFITKVVLSPSFIKESVKVVQDNFLEMEEYWEKLGEDTIFELNHWMKRYIIDTVFVILINKPAYALANYYNKITSNKKLTVPDGVLKEGDMFLESIDVFVNSLVYFFLVPKSIRNFPGFKGYTQYLKGKVDWLRSSLHEIVKSRREEISKTPIDQELKCDMLTMFLTVNTERDVTERIADELHDEPMSDKVAVANLLEVFAGSIETTSHSLCFIVDLLENNPKAKQQMIEEIERVLGKNTNSIFTLENLTKLEYVEAVIKEASRLRTISPILYKKNSVPVEIGGYKWSKDNYFGLHYNGIYKNKSYWKDPDTFNPDRFINNPKSKNKFYMFGGGLRECPGKKLAMMELKATIAMLYRKYDIKLMGPLKEHIGTGRVCDELKVKLKKRET